MKLSGNTVFVLGAGFTKAFASNAPLVRLRQSALNYQDLAKKYAEFPNVIKILGLSDQNPEVNMEEMFSRLFSGTPYDSEFLSDGERTLLLNDFRKIFFGIIEASTPDATNVAILNNFARLVVDNDCTCVTFNYDTILDQALFEYRGITEVPVPPIKYWHPDGGYGFFCRPVSSVITETRPTIKDQCDSLLLKLHGSLNWRIKLGTQPPYPIDSIVHDETWSGAHYNLNEEDLMMHLEKTPFVIPPILDKTAITEQPILRVVWSSAFKKIRDAQNIIFIGYSLPKTDIAAKFLFKESVEKQNVYVVTSNNKIDDKKSTYREVIPNIPDTNFVTAGGLEWIQQLITDNTPIATTDTRAK